MSAGRSIIAGVGLAMSLLGLMGGCSTQPPKPLNVPSSTYGTPQVVVETRAFMESFARGQYALAFESVSKRSKCQCDGQFAAFQSLANQTSANGFRPETLREATNYSLVEGLTVDQVKRVLLKLCTKDTTRDIRQEVWPYWDGGDVLPVQYQVRGQTFVQLMVREDGRWKTFNLPCTLTLDDLTR